MLPTITSKVGNLRGDDRQDFPFVKICIKNKM